jgi:hypothetical protein
MYLLYQYDDHTNEKVIRGIFSALYKIENYFISSRIKYELKLFVKEKNVPAFWCIETKASKETYFIEIFEIDVIC